MTNKNPEIGHSIDANGIATNYQDWGEGEATPLLMIHGSGPGVSAWANWRLCLPELSKSRRVIAPDVVGFGFTERPVDAVYTLDYWVGHFVAFLDALGLEKVDIVGNSFGGALAMATASRYPNRVRKLVLMGSTGIDFELTPGLAKVWGYRPSVEAMRELLDVFIFNKQNATDELARLRYEASIRPGFQDAYEKMFYEPLQGCISEIATPDDKIAQITQPCLVVHGREDEVIPLSNAQHLFELLPNAELHVFRNCGHWTQIEQSVRFNALVDGFLSA